MTIYFIITIDAAVVVTIDAAVVVITIISSRVVVTISVAMIIITISINVMIVTTISTVMIITMISTVMIIIMISVTMIINTTSTAMIVITISTTSAMIPSLIVLLSTISFACSRSTAAERLLLNYRQGIAIPVLCYSIHRHRATVVFIHSLIIIGRHLMIESTAAFISTSLHRFVEVSKLTGAVNLQYVQTYFTRREGSQLLCGYVWERTTS